MHTIVRTGRVIASVLDDQRYALGGWRSGSPGRWGQAAPRSRQGIQVSNLSNGSCRESPSGMTSVGLSTGHNATGRVASLVTAVARSGFRVLVVGRAVA